MKKVADWTWESYEGGAIGTHEDTDAQIEIAAIQDEAQTSKWNETYTAGRSWAVYLEDGSSITGRSSDLRVAKREAVSALMERIAS